MRNLKKNSEPTKWSGYNLVELLPGYTQILGKGSILDLSIPAPKSITFFDGTSNVGICTSSIDKIEDKYNYGKSRIQWIFKTWKKEEGSYNAPWTCIEEYMWDSSERKYVSTNKEEYSLSTPNYTSLGDDFYENIENYQVEFSLDIYSWNFQSEQVGGRYFFEPYYQTVLYWLSEDLIPITEYRIGINGIYRIEEEKESNTPLTSLTWANNPDFVNPVFNITV